MSSNAKQKLSRPCIRSHSAGSLTASSRLERGEHAPSCHGGLREREAAPVVSSRTRDLAVYQRGRSSSGHLNVSPSRRSTPTPMIDPAVHVREQLARAAMCPAPRQRRRRFEPALCREQSSLQLEHQHRFAGSKEVRLRDREHRGHVGRAVDEAFPLPARWCVGVCQAGGEARRGGQMKDARHG
jgi:hypothetical protein